jgi:hypothetical protein
MGFGIDHLALVQNEAVQKELDLVDDQIGKIRDLADSRRPGRRGAGGDRPNFAEMTEQQRREFMAQRRAESKAEVKKILLDDQFARLDQIYLQVAGAAALTDPDVVAKLGLSDDQQAKIATTREEAQEENRAQMRELRQSGDPAAARAKMEELRKAADEKVLAHLTDEQKQQFASMKGEAFELPPGSLFPGRGGPRGFGGPGGPGGRGPRGDRPDRPQRPE